VKIRVAEKSIGRRGSKQKLREETRILENTTPFLSEKASKKKEKGSKSGAYRGRKISLHPVDEERRKKKHAKKMKKEKGRIRNFHGTLLRGPGRLGRTTQNNLAVVFCEN